MQRLSRISDRLAGRAAMLAGAAAAAGGVTETVHSQRHNGNNVVGEAGYLTLSFFVVFLISVAPSFIALARRARSEIAVKAAVAAGAGTLALGLTAITSLINGRDLGMFNVIAPGHQRSLAVRLGHHRRLAQAGRHGQHRRRGRTADRVGGHHPARHGRRRRTRRRLLPGNRLPAG